MKPVARYAEHAFVFAGVLAAVFALQWRDGAYQNELGGHPDEPAHYVTGRMVADYVTTSLGSDPKEFAEAYYVRYPKVAIGHWPPLFYVVLGGWFALFGGAYWSTFVLMAVITSLFAFTVGRMVRNEYGPIVALLASLLSIAFPFVHTTTACVMSDPITAILSTWAILVYGRYLDIPGIGRGAAFGLVASAAIMTKGNAAALGLMVPLAVAIGMRWTLLRRLSFWLPGFLVIAICAPWYIATRGMASNGMVTLDWHALPLIEALIKPAKEAVQGFGVIVTIVAVIGLLLTVRRRRETAMGKRLALAAFLPAFFLLQTFTVPGERRYLVFLVPAVLIFFLDGAAWVLAKLGEAKVQRYARVVVSLLLAGWAVSLVATFNFPSKSCRGCGDVVEFLLSQPDLCRRPMLICSDASGEGMFVAETLRQDSQRRCLVLRASKVFASSPWSREDYVPFVQTPEDVAALLGRLQIGAIIVDASVPEPERDLHDRLLAESLGSKSSAYHLLRSSSIVRGKCHLSDGLRIYAANNSAEEGSTDIEIDMRHSLSDPLKARVGPAGLEILHQP